MQNLKEFVQIITYYTLFYPIIMSIFWVLGGIIYSLKSKEIDSKEYNKLEEEPLTIIVPVYNEEDNLKYVIEENLKLNYKNYEMWIIDDLSSDDSFNIMKNFESEKIKVFQNKERLGKAKTLNKYLDKLQTKYFMVVDSDTILDPECLKILNYNIYEDENKKDDEKENKVAAYTGNLTVYAKKENKTLLIQKTEYRSFIDMIKRTQMVLWGSVMTLSGAFSLYKLDKVLEVGGFDHKNATEDINISWKLNQSGYKLKYLSQAQALVHTPMYIYDLINQRQRWTVGLLQTIYQNFKKLFNLKNNRLKFFTLEIFLSGFWAFTFFFSSIYYIFCILTKLIENLLLFRFLYGIILVLIFSILLSLIAYSISKNNREPLGVFLKNYFWFPFAFFLVQSLGFVKGIKSFVFETNHGLWRNTTQEKGRYLFATVSDILITFIILRVVLEILEDGYSVYNNIPVMNLLIGYMVFAFIYLFLYYKFFKVGNKFVNRNYPLKYNISFYLVLVNYVINIYQVYYFYINTRINSDFYSYSYIRLLLYLLGTIILYYLFKNKVKNIQ